MGAGTTFYFEIPMQQQGGAEDLHQNELISRDKRKLKRKKILLVEDDPSCSEMLAEMLKPGGHELLFVKTGNEAMNMVKKDSPDLVLLDVGLPDISGYDVAREILQINSNVKIIAQTAYASEEEAKKAMNAGCVECISKPIMGKQLREIVSRHFNN
jgi:CheY-like chemotaxis protein